MQNKRCARNNFVPAFTVKTKVSVTDVQEQTEEEKNAVEIGEEEKSEDADTTTDAAAEEENKD